MKLYKDNEVVSRILKGFVYESVDDDADELKSIVFFYGINEKSDKKEQRIWKQKFRMENGTCYLDEGIYNGNGEEVEIRHKNHNTGLRFIPARVIINDGLTGDLKGESDVSELIELQEAYNRLSSDDVDALKFNMFPMTIAVGAAEESLKKMTIAPNALVDLQPEDALPEGSKLEMYKLESKFDYGTRLENALDRIKSEMHDLLNIPNVSPDQLKGYITSGKSMKALYWQLITRCEEKFATWRPALEWMAQTIITIAKTYHIDNLPDLPDMCIKVENIYPLFDDELEEKAIDMQAVNTQVMSKKKYIEKWSPGVNENFADDELAQIQKERTMLDDSYTGGLDYGGGGGDA